MDSSVRVSVVVPCYNTATYLDQCLSSIREDRGVSLEIIVLNDGSTDASLETMRAHESADDRVRVIDKPNQGYGATVNRGIDEARGDYIAIVEPDDYLVPGMYTELIGLADRYGAPDLVRSSYWRVWMPDTPQEHLYRCSYYDRIKPGRMPFTLADCPRIIQHHPSIWTCLYKRSFLDEFGIRFKEVPGAGWVDNPFLIETSVQARSIAYTDEAFYCYREDLPASSSTKRSDTLPFERWNDMADIVERLGVSDKGIIEALYVIGFRYIGGAIGEGALDDLELVKLIQGVFKRMDPSIVAGMSHVSPSFKKKYFELSGYEPRAISRVPYYKNLVSEFFYCWRTNGFSFAMSRTGGFLKRLAADHGVGNPSSTRSASI